MPWYKLSMEQTVLELSQDILQNTSNWIGDSMLLAISGALAGCARATWDIWPTVQLTSLMLIVQLTILGLFWEIPMQLVSPGIFRCIYTCLLFPMNSAYWDRICEAK